MQSSLRRTHATSCSNALLLSSSIIPPLFLSSSTRYHYITVFLRCSATCLASPSLICPACLYFIPLCLSPPPLLTQSFYRPPHPSPPPTGRLAAAYSPRSAPPSPIGNHSGVFCSLSNEETETDLRPDDSSNLLETNGRVRESSWFSVSLCVAHVRPPAFSSPAHLAYTVVQVPLRSI